MIEGKRKVIRKAKDLEVGDVINFTLNKPAGWKIKSIDEPTEQNEFERWFQLETEDGQDAGYVGYDPDSVIEIVLQ